MEQVGDLTRQTFLVTGSAGFIGFHVARTLLVPGPGWWGWTTSTTITPRP